MDFNLNTIFVFICIFISVAALTLAAKAFSKKNENESKSKKVISVILLIIAFFADATTIINNVDDYYERHHDQSTTVTTTESTTTTTVSTTSATTASSSSTTKKETEITNEVTIDGNDSTTCIVHQFGEYEDIPYTKKFYAPSTGIYGFKLNINSVKNSYKLTVFNSKEEEVFSKYYYNSNDSETGQELIGGEYYIIQIESTEGAPRAEITIYYPAQPKQ